MQLTDIKIRKVFDEGPMRAVVSVTFDGQFAVHDIKVIYANDKFFIVMPSRKNADGTYRDIAHPINAEFRSVMENAVLAEFQIALKAHEEEKLQAAEETLFSEEVKTEEAPVEEVTVTEEVPVAEVTVVEEVPVAEVTVVEEAPVEEVTVIEGAPVEEVTVVEEEAPSDEA